MKGKFSPRNPGKYVGDYENIIYRSSWERIFMKWLDDREEIKSWQSEEKCLWYYDPVTKKNRRYFPDFIIKYDKNGALVTEMVEIKPHHEVIGPPTNPKMKTKTWVTQVKNYITNQAKWDAAKKICEERGWSFRLVTEYELGIKPRKPR